MALVEVASFPDPMAAEIALGRLASEGIEGVLFDAGLAGLGMGPLFRTRLMVLEEDRNAAERVLAGA
jgi:hypothetical protein